MNLGSSQGGYTTKTFGRGSYSAGTPDPWAQSNQGGKATSKASGDTWIVPSMGDWNKKPHIPATSQREQTIEAMALIPLPLTVPPPPTVPPPGLADDGLPETKAAPQALQRELNPAEDAQQQQPLRIKAPPLSKQPPRPAMKAEGNKATTLPGSVGDVSHGSDGWTLLPTSFLGSWWPGAAGLPPVVANKADASSQNPAGQQDLL